MSTTRSALFSAALERAINKALDYDPGTRIALNDLTGKVLAVQCTQPQGTLYFVIEQNAIAVHNHYEHECHCKLSGDLAALATVAFKSTTSLANTNVYIEGNPGVLSQLLDILKQLDIDWEEAIGDHLGSLPGHLVGQILRSKGEWLKTRAQQMPQYLREIITEELRLVPSPFEAEAFYQDVSDLRSQTARLEARISQLKACQ